MSNLYVGKDVWYRPRAHEAGPYPGKRPLAAIVTHIHANEDLNLFVFGMDGSTHGLSGIPYYDAEDRPALPGYAEPQVLPDVQPTEDFVVIPETPRRKKAKVEEVEDGSGI